MEGCCLLKFNTAAVNLFLIICFLAQRHGCFYNSLVKVYLEYSLSINGGYLAQLITVIQRRQPRFLQVTFYYIHYGIPTSFPQHSHF